MLGELLELFYDDYTIQELLLILHYLSFGNSTCIMPFFSTEPAAQVQHARFVLARSASIVCRAFGKKMLESKSLLQLRHGTSNLIGF